MYMRFCQLRRSFFLTLLSWCLLSGCASVFNQQTFTLQGDHGRLAVDFHGKSSCPLVIILHGFNANKDMPLLTELSNQLRSRGACTLLFDFNGHGRSDGAFVDMTIPNELEDARRVYQFASQLPQISSISLVGHSQGAVVAAMLAGELGADQIKALVLMSPAPELKEDVTKGNLFGITFDPKNPPAFITLSNGLKVGRAYLQTTQHLPIYEVSAKYTGPVLVLHSQDDQLVPYKYGEEMSKIYKQGHLETVLGYDHNFTQDTPTADAIVTDFLVEQLFSK